MVIKSTERKFCPPALKREGRSILVNRKFILFFNLFFFDKNFLILRPKDGEISYSAGICQNKVVVGK